MSDKTLGLYGKYRVERVDGKPVKWCFVLEDTDPLARFALATYADMAEETGSLALATDLRTKVSELPRRRLDGWDMGSHSSPNRGGGLHYFVNGLPLCGRSGCAGEGDPKVADGYPGAADLIRRIGCRACVEARGAAR